MKCSLSISIDHRSISTGAFEQSFPLVSSPLVASLLSLGGSLPAYPYGHRERTADERSSGDPPCRRVVVSHTHSLFWKCKAEMMDYQNLNFYLKKSIKELQKLCKQHDLPANRSHAQLAKSLVSLFKKRNASSASSLEKSTNSKDGISKKSFVSETKVKETFISLDESAGGLFGRSNSSMVNIHGRSSSISEIPGESRSLCQTGNQMKLIGHMVNLTSGKPQTWPANNKGTEGFGSSSEHCNMGTISCVAADIQEIATNRLHGLECKRVSEAHLENCWIIEIQSPLEWINSLKDEVCVHQNAEHHESRTLSKDISGSPEDDHMKISPSVDSGMHLQCVGVDRNTGCTNSSLSSVVSENCNSEAYPPDTTVVTSGSSVLTSGSVPAGLSGCLEENQVVSSSCAAYSVQNNVTPDIASCPQEGILLTQDSIDASFAMVKSNASPPDASTKSIDNKDVGAITPVTTVGVEDNALSNTLSDAPDKKHVKTQLCMPLTSCQIMPVHEGLPNSVQLIGPMVPDGPMADAQSEVGQMAFSINQCSGVQTSLDNGSKRSSNLEFPEEIHVKRQHTCENMSGTIMDLKSTKSSAKEATSDEVVIPRRSTRLVSKVQSAPL
ncbi:hypothetical protein MUK42_33484 [Musa troglodytarum]|uniref:Uncharacterized protein n=1 Tax=Musa troglodytarum TaxID=320322 RepID=A0A9E7G9T6_9LILI|nr:hypothetical protein MUK42_33484 [Musa troglodytarum]